MADPATAENLAGEFASLLEPAPEAEGPAGARPEALPSMPGGESLPLSSAAGLSPAYAAAETPSPGADPSQAGLRALVAAIGEIGVQEEPPGSNDGPRIAQYRTATAGAANTPGRWCAYFVSWAAAQAGAPLGDQGQGYGSVAQIEDWARRTGRLVPPGESPRPGDMILFGTEHVGIVESVGPGDRLTTVEGNHDDRVERVDRTLAEATGFVRL
jgi:cell wall-associated NlpC family hydrolase